MIQAPNLGQTDDDLAALAKALGHPARIGIVRLLIEKQSCIGCDIVQEIQLAQSTVSEHLRILKAAGIITGEIERPRVCYSLNPASLLPLTSLLNAVFGQDAESAPRRPVRGASNRGS
jgi:ArsR family transcriptional regulator